MDLVANILIFLVPLVLAVTMHEAAHGLVADYLGDGTARRLGRITLNPIPHIDLIGTILLPLALFVLGTLSVGHGILFGWAKPVPVVPSRLHRPRRDMALVALAGPGANLLMAVAWGGLLAAANYLEITSGISSNILNKLALFGLLINAALLVLNMLPILPLDGGRVLAALLPRPVAAVLARLEPFGILILLVLLFGGVLGPVVMPMIFGLRSGILQLFGLI